LGCHFLLGASVGATAEPDAKWVKLSTVPYTLNNKQDAITFADASAAGTATVPAHIPH